MYNPDCDNCEHAYMERWENYFGKIACPVCEWVYKSLDISDDIRDIRHCPHCGARLYPPEPMEEDV